MAMEGKTLRKVKESKMFFAGLDIQERIYLPRISNNSKVMRSLTLISYGNCGVSRFANQSYEAKP